MSDNSLIEIEQSLIGKFNVYNVLGVVTVCKVLGIKNEFIKLGVKELKTVEGRFQQIIKKPFVNKRNKTEI